MQFITAKELEKILRSDTEIALLDVRERNPFSKEHLLLSSCVQLGRLETMTGDLVPRFSTRIVLVGDGPSDAGRLEEKAAARLAELGYTNISILEGGISGWREAGFELYSGVNVLSKAFGEIVSETYKTPFISARDEQARIERGEKHIVLDSRPKSEYNRMTIPTSVNAPGAELVYRVHDAVPDSGTPVVVHCAGRTRSIIGAQSLVNAGIPNPVAALENGTMGWQLAGFELEYGQRRFASPPSPEGLARAKECAARVAKRFGVGKVSRKTLDQWKRESGERTLYIIDVRLPDEFKAGHIEGTLNVQGGQLIQATEEFIGVQNARVVLVDDTEVRATMTGSWLIQLGWADVFVLEGGLGGLPLVEGPGSPKLLGFEKAKTVTAVELESLLKDFQKKAAVLDLAYSAFYKEHHIPGAWWGIRSRLDRDLADLPQSDCLIVTSEDGILAHYAARQLEKSGFERNVLVLEGGTRAWIEAGLPVSKGIEHALSELEDTWYMPYMFPDAPRQAKIDYLDWEIALVAQIERDATAKFRIFPEE